MEETRGEARQLGNPPSVDQHLQQLGRHLHRTSQHQPRLERPQYGDFQDPYSRPLWQECQQVFRQCRNPDQDRPTEPEKQESQKQSTGKDPARNRKKNFGKRFWDDPF